MRDEAVKITLHVRTARLEPGTYPLIAGDIGDWAAAPGGSVRATVDHQAAGSNPWEKVVYRKGGAGQLQIEARAGDLISGRFDLRVRDEEGREAHVSGWMRRLPLSPGDAPW